VNALNITVFCGSSLGNRELYGEAAKAVGRWIADHGYTLVYGGRKSGLMGVLADEVLLHRGKVIGVIPSFLMEGDWGHPKLTRLEVVSTMSERKNRMFELGNCYIALPGGPGTLEEISDVISWARIGRHQNPCILFNAGGYYDKLKEFYDQMVSQGFLTQADRDRILFSDSFPEIEEFIRTYSPPSVNLNK
jgi:conserved hypothetical protein, DprA/Smf-related, family 2